MAIQQASSFQMLQAMTACTSLRRQAHEMRMRAKYNTQCAAQPYCTGSLVAHYIARAADFRQEAAGLEHAANGWSALVERHLKQGTGVCENGE